MFTVTLQCVTLDTLCGYTVDTLWRYSIWPEIPSCNAKILCQRDVRAGWIFLSERFFSHDLYDKSWEKIFQTKIFAQLWDLGYIKFSFCVTLFIAYTSFKDLLLRNTLHFPDTIDIINMLEGCIPRHRWHNWTTPLTLAAALYLATLGRQRASDARSSKG